MSDVDRLILAGARSLRFPPAVEALFDAWTVDARRRHIISNNAIGLVAYEAFLVSDYFIVGDIFALSLFLHLAVMLPTMIVVNLIVARVRRAWIRETVLAAGIVLTTSAILLLTLMSRAPHRDYEHFSIVLAVLFATIVQKIHFWFVSAACLTALALTATALSFVYAGSPDRLLFADATFACVVIFSLVGSYKLERERRLGFLLRLKDKLRTSELEAASLLDPLTRVGNRRALDQALDEAVSTKAAAAMLLVDIDHFKEYNDCHGHQAGDVCLQRIAQVIALAIGPNNRVYRFGGEEFLVLMLDSTLTDAVDVAERIRETLALQSIPGGGPDGAPITVSIGAAASSFGPGATSSDLVAAADAALYAAKRSGRDRVRQAPGAAEPIVVPFAKRVTRR